MLIRLAWRGFRKQAKSYLLFFFSMIFAVMVYYSFNAMTYEQPLIRGTGEDTQVVNMLAFGSVLVVLNLLFFMLTTSRFFIENRRKDIGVFHLYGLKFYQICLWFVFELFFIGVVSFVFGILLGILFSKLFGMILVKAMGLTIEVTFFVSVDALRTTASVMLFILASVSVQIVWLIFGQKAARANNEQVQEVQARQFSAGEKMLAWLGIFLLLSGWSGAIKYLLIVKKLVASMDLLQANILALLGIFLLCLVGTYLFFAQTMRWYNARQTTRGYKNLNVLSRGEWQLRLFKEWNFLGTIAILVGLSLAILGGTAAFVSIQMKAVNEQAPVSLLMDHKEYEKIAPQLQQKIPYTSETVHFKTVGAGQTMRFTGEEADKTPELVDLVAVSEYNQLQKVIPELSAIQLKSEESGVILTPLQSVFKEYVHYNKNVQLKQAVLQIQGVKTNFLGAWILRYSNQLIVVSDSFYHQAEGISYQLQAVKTDSSKEKLLNNTVNEHTATAWIEPIHEDLQWKDKQLIGAIHAGEGKQEKRPTFYRTNYVSYQDTYHRARNQAGLLLFVVTFVTMTFILTTASTVSLHQISTVTRKKAQYTLLQKIGIPSKKLQQEIYRETRNVFFFPAILGLVHSFFALYIVTQIVEKTNYWFVYLFCGILLVVYSVFFILTCVYQKKLLAFRE